MASLSEFAQTMRTKGEKIETNVNKVVIKLAGAALQTVVLATPVETGRARGAWITGINSAPTAQSERLDPSGVSAIASGKSKIETRRQGQTIFISNNVDYIGFLNNGSSSQAPANFVEAAVRQAAAVVKTAKVLD